MPGEDTFALSRSRPAMQTGDVTRDAAEGSTSASATGFASGVASVQQADEPWRVELEHTAAHLLALDRHDVMDVLTRQFEATLIRMALRHTGGRRIEAAQRLGIGRNTITRKIQDLGLDDVR